MVKSNMIAAACLLLLSSLLFGSCDDGSIPASATRLEAIAIVNTHKDRNGVLSEALAADDEPFRLELELFPSSVPDDVRSKAVWESSAPDVLECASDGTVSPKAAGSAAITASIEDSGRKIGGSLTFSVFDKDFGGNSEDSDFIFYYYNDGQASADANRLRMNKCRLNDKRIVVPREVLFNGKVCQVACIDDDAFKDNVAVEEIVLPDTVSAIGRSAFSGCRNLESITLSEQLETIGQSSFYGCRSLLAITLPGKVREIGNNAFNGCAKLFEINNYSQLDIDLNSADRTKGDYFGGIAGVAVRINKDKSAEGQSRLIKNGSITYLLNDDNTLTAVKADSNVVRLNGFDERCYDIYASAFSNLSCLEEVDLTGSAIKRIGNGAFASCSALTSIMLNDGLEFIGGRAFEKCSGIKNLTIPDSVVEISEYALSGCNALESLSVPFIGKYLDPDGKSEVSDRWKYPLGYFFSTSGSEGSYAAWQFSPYYSASQDKWSYFGEASGGAGMYYIPSSLKSVEVTKSTELVFEAFENCVSLESVTLNSNMTKLGNKCFRNCVNIKSIVIPDSVQTFEHSGSDTHFSYPFDGCRFDSVTYSRKAADDSYEFANGKLTIKDVPTSASASPQWFLDGLNPLVFEVEFVGSSLTRTAVPKNCFRDCANLKRLDLPANFKSLRQAAFYDCISFEGFGDPQASDWFSIPSGITEIGEEAFAFCKAIEKIEVPASVISIGSGAFGGCTAIMEMNLPFVGRGGYLEAGNKYHFGYVFGANQKFSGNAVEITQPSSTPGSSNPKYWIPSSVKRVRIRSGEIGYGAFSGCAGIESVALDDGVSSIGQWAFYSCTGLTSITLPSDIASLTGYQCFADCVSLESIVIPESCVQIGSDVFSGLSALASSWSLGVFLKSSSNVVPAGFDSNWNKRDNSFDHPYYFYSESLPTEDGGFWHYVDGNPVIWEH